MLNYRIFGLTVVLGLLAAAVYAQSQNEVWNRVFDSATNSLRVVIE